MTEDISLNHNVFVEDSNGLNKISNIYDNNSDSDGDDIKFKKTKSKLKRLTESDSETDKENDVTKFNTVSSPQKSDSEDSSNGEAVTAKRKSRIRNISNSDSESLPGTDSIALTNKYDLSRTKIKNKNLQDKFKKLKHAKSTPSTEENLLNVQSSGESEDRDTDHSLDGEISCLKIKQKLKKKTSQSLAAICDPDTSEDESNVKDVKVQKSKPRSIKLTSAKPARMSAKQAMENMQKIKSESNRMLREKEVSLPYHRPKALCLKDIMNRRKPALTSDGKALPIKMNTEQLRQYSLMLEQRQKEMMELCRSESDEEEQTEENLSENKFKESNAVETLLNLNHENSNTSDANDKTFDDITMEHSMNDSQNNINEHNIQNENVGHDTLEKDNSENCENKIENIENQKEELMEISLSHENHSSRSSNCSNKETVVMAEEEDQLMEVLPEKNESQSIDKQKNNEQESQVISLHYDSEKTEVTNSRDKNCDLEVNQAKQFQEVIDLGTSEKTDNDVEKTLTNNDKPAINDDEFSDDDFTMEELDKIIENAEVNKDTSHKPLPKLEATLGIKPTLTGTPGTVINLDEDDDTDNTQKKLTGVEILKERYKYFAKLKSDEEKEKDREKKFKPGIQHLKLKQKLEEEIAEQRSLEWEKRLQVENQLKSEINGVEGEEFDGEDIENIEAKLDENDVVDDEEEESSSEEEIEDTVYDVKDKPRIRNPLIDDQAEVSEEENIQNNDPDCKEDADDNDGDENNEDDENDTEDDDEESSESEEEEPQKKSRKGRILKAFEDSDDEEIKSDAVVENTSESQNNEIRESQDDEILLAQPQKTCSDDLFSSQECATQKALNREDEPKVTDTSLEDLGSQTFSIMNTATKNTGETKDVVLDKIDVICETQAGSEDNFEGIVGMCTGGFSENVVTPQAESSQLSQSQEIGDDVAELCTGKFYDNPFVSQTEAEGDINDSKTEDDSITEMTPEKTDEVTPDKVDNPKPTNEGENKLLKSILDELDDPEFDAPKPNKYFFNATKTDKDGKKNIENSEFKKKFVIESDDEINENDGSATKKKKRKKRKLENRALQISDDEEEYSEVEQDTYESEIEEDNDRLVEYDSEENEVEVTTKIPKTKRVGAFFEQEAELTSEDEWVGSGDEDEAGLDRMEREEGDDDTFHQGKLQRELGEIHMREVLDQDKREVRLLQELLFEDGDLGDGHRQRKFRWKNADGEEELGTNADEYADTQEDEFESEEQWRKQRHEREMFLRKLQEKDEDDANISINRSAFIKATLASKTTADTTLEKSPNVEKTSPETKPRDSAEKKTANNIPSPKKPFILLQQNYHNSLLTRGRGALARLAALATPLAGDGDDAPKVNASSNRGNFVFAAITPEAGNKTTKRKADTAPDTPRLLKKMKQETNRPSKSSLLDHL